MISFPNAKINIGLNITGRRADGYHNLETVFYPVRIHDVLEVVEWGMLQFTSSGIPIPGRKEDNLCLKAYQLMRQDHALPPVHLHLHKHIPIGAGLGGGSADAGFFIRLINERFALGLTLEQQENYARKLGADCAFFIRNKPVFATGKGDEFEPVSLDLSAFCIVLVMPEVTVSTAEAYRGVKPKTPAYVLKEVLDLHPREWGMYISNDFEHSVFKNHPSIRGVKAALYDAGALYAAMSGSGSSVFGIFEKRPDLASLERQNVVFYDI